MKKAFALFISLVLLVNLLPMSAALADTEYVEVTVNSASIRNDYYDTGDVLQWVSRGTMLRVIDSKRNLYLNKWYKVEYDTGYSCVRGWIYAGEVAEHKHHYQEFYYNDNKFGVCTSCRTVAIEQVSTVEYNKANALTAALPAVGGLAAADGPLPVGEIAGLVILGLAYLEIGYNPSDYMIREWARTASIDDYLSETNSCSVQSFYIVERTGSKLVKKSNKCLNVFQAYLYSRFLNQDVWTMDPDAAFLCACMNGFRHFGPERDCRNSDVKYFHYHYGTDHNHYDAHTHIFFSTNNYGETPLSSY